MARRILRKKSRAGAPDSASESTTTFPFTALPYELQLQIAHHAVLAPVPILIGRRPRPLRAPAHLPSSFAAAADPPPSATELAAHAQRALAITQTCRALSSVGAPALTRAHFASNAFELGYYFASPGGFWTHPQARARISHVVLDARRLVRPVEGHNPVVEWLTDPSNLPGLRKVSVRLRRSTETVPCGPDRWVLQENEWLGGGMASEIVVLSSQATWMLRDLCRNLLRLEVVECVVEATHGLTQYMEAWLPDFERRVRTKVTEETIWEAGPPAEWTVPRLEVGPILICDLLCPPTSVFENVSASFLSRTLKPESFLARADVPCQFRWCMIQTLETPKSGPVQPLSGLRSWMRPRAQGRKSSRTSD